MCPRCGHSTRCSSCGRFSNGAGSASSRSRRSRFEHRYAQWDAERRFNVPAIDVSDPVAAQCGEVLKGVLKPQQCKLFGRECTPERPIGALMVSSEGACAAYYARAARADAAAVPVAGALG